MIASIRFSGTDLYFSDFVEKLYRLQVVKVNF